MRLPNSYGSVYKLSGNRRNPWVARKTIGWKETQKKTMHPEYKFIGYFSTKKAALEALAIYNHNPYEGTKITISQLYDMWAQDHWEKVTDKTISHYKYTYKVIADLHDRAVIDITLDDLQRVIDNSGKNKPSLRSIRNTISLMYDYAFKHGYIPLEKKQLVSYIDISKAGNPDGKERVPFSQEEIDTLWKNVDYKWVKYVLILIYTGVRISELLELKKSNVFIKKKYFKVVRSKTKAGLRDVPICDKIFPIIEDLMSKRGAYLITTENGGQMKYATFYNWKWVPTLNALNMPHTPHDARHTLITMLTAAGVDERIIRPIVGHRGEGVTQIVYTHISLEEKLKAINKI